MKQMFAEWYLKNKGSRFWRTCQQIEERYNKYMIKARDKMEKLFQKTTPDDKCGSSVKI
jgi:hypothetical protein